MECEMPQINSNMDEMRDIFEETKTIAIIGCSPNSEKASNRVAVYLQNAGFKIIPVYPKEDVILGEKVYRSLTDIPTDINVDMVDIFRNSNDAYGVTEDAIEIGAKVVWMQLAIINEAAAEMAQNAGLEVVMDRCPKIEYSRLFGELGWSGINTGVISSKRRKVGRK